VVDQEKGGEGEGDGKGRGGRENGNTECGFCGVIYGTVDNLRRENILKVL
jgi:hypothetical protein